MLRREKATKHIRFVSLFPQKGKKKKRKKSKNPIQNMAQKREKEETELKVPGKNLQICNPPSLIPPPSTSILAATRPPSEIPDPKSSITFTFEASSSEEANRPGVLKRPRNVTRCSGSGCRKRVGLMGIRCRCGDVFCPEHRYSDRHECSYDYKAAGREAIAKENPVVRASKLLKV